MSGKPARPRSGGAGGAPPSRKRARTGDGRRGGGDGDEEDTGPKAKVSTTRREESEIQQLEARIARESPAPGSGEAPATEFAQLPLSRYTLTGLQRGKFRVMTQVQRVAIAHALAGRDVLGAAKTGSGKTLAFLVPLLERLYRARWAAGDGLGALVISPTRELAMQIFEVLRTVGAAHYALSAGLVCGGKSFEEEGAAIGRMAVLVATPGRLLQHLEQSAALDASGLQVLVLDEADRLLDMGFADALNAILGHLPRAAPGGRQTLLFSATQTKSVRDLARLSLAGAPEYVAVHEAAAAATPARLAHTYVTVRLGDKLNCLYSFVRSHTAAKTIVFVSSGKQARFLFEAFRRLRPGVPLQLLHGRMKQARRQLVYFDFLRKPAAVLFATDVAARGLDFPSVDWVVQVDAPEDAAAYIHRVGRTARHKARGHGLLLLTPAEAPGALAALAAAKVAPTPVSVSAAAAVSVTGKLAAEVAADPALKALAQRAFASYVRSVYLQPDKAVFDVRALPLAEFAESLGLAAPPAVPLLARLAAGGGGGGGGGADDDAAAASADRVATHAKKNENKALARLKASIAAGKAARKAAAAAASAGGAGPAATTAAATPSAAAAPRAAAASTDDAGSDSSDEDSGSDGADAGAADSSGWSGRARGGGGSGGGGGAASGGLLVRRRPSADADAAPGAGSDAEGEDDLAGGAAVAALTDVERARVRRVAATTVALGAAGGGRAGERGADGLTPFERLARERAAAAGAGSAGAAADAPASRAPLAPPQHLGRAAAEHAARIAARLAATAEADRAAERARVRTKHQEQRRRAKGRGDGSDDDDDEGGDGGGVRLGGDWDGAGSEGGSGGGGDGGADEGGGGGGDGDGDDGGGHRRRAVVLTTAAATARPAPTAAPRVAKAPSGAKSRKSS